MPAKTKLQIALTLLLSAVVTIGAAGYPQQSWFVFLLFLLAILISSSFKVALPRGDGSMSLNFPFILLGITQLSPLQVILLTAISVAVQCRIRVMKIFTAVQIAFNVANATISSVCAYAVYASLQQHGMATAPRLAIASAAYFLWNTISVAGVIASTKDESAIHVWRTEFPWYLPFYLVGGVLASTASWMSVRFGWTTALLLIPMVYTVYRAYTSQMSRLEERQRYLEETEALQLRTIEGLAMAIEAKDQGTHDHLFRVRSYVQQVGEALKLTDLEMRALQTAAFLHDIGKLAVPEHIINKPGKLTPEEFEKMKIHPIVGADILERVRFPYPVVPMVRAHHEWWDGSGYPDGLAGDAIPIGARILTVVDCFDALVSDRPYRKSLGEEKAFNIIKSMSGKQFDPNVVEVFQRLYDKMKSEAESAIPADFIPLNTEIQVTRGAAPGAGFEKHSESSSGSEPESPNSKVTSIDTIRKIASANHEAQTLYELTLALGTSLSYAEALTMVVQRIQAVIPFDGCALYRKSGNLVRACFTHGEGAACFAEAEMPLGEGISGWAAQSGKAILNGNAHVEPSRSSIPFKSALAIPLLNPKSESIGTITLYSVQADAFHRDDLRVLQAMEAKLSLSVQHVFRAADATELESPRLQQLPDARDIFVKLEQAIAAATESREGVIVVACDLNAFKQINETHGRSTGDRFLADLAQAFLEACGPRCSVARIGGDEFVFLLTDACRSQTHEELEFIGNCLESVSERHGFLSSTTASTGVSFYPTDGVNAEELLAIANRRMYLSKQTHYKNLSDAAAEHVVGVLAACKQ